MNNYEKLFGTPEMAAGFLSATIQLMSLDEACCLFDRCNNCPMYDANISPKCWENPTAESVLKWLESEACDD